VGLASPAHDSRPHRPDEDAVNRRTFINTVGGVSAVRMWPRGAFASEDAGRRVRVESAAGSQPAATARPAIRFAAVGLSHSHVYGQVATVLKHGGTLAAVYDREPELLAAFSKRHPQAKVARSEQEILDDPTIQLVVSAAIPNERASLGVRVMQAGKDYMSDKPGVTSLEQLAEIRRVQAQTRRIYSILYGGRLESGATQRAVELVHAGAIGRVLQTMGTGPHKIGANRAGWFWNKAQSGGVIGDLGTHQVDYFFAFTGATRAEVVASQVGNLHHPDRPAFEDFGDALLRSPSGSGYFRVDWFTPGGVATFGDSRLTIMGTDGYIEVRPNVDLAGRPGGGHLFLVDQKETRYIDATRTPLPYGGRLLDDIVNRTETAMPQALTFMVAQLVLEAQSRATSPVLPT
jgi:predicted dehydrogenase